MPRALPKCWTCKGRNVKFNVPKIIVEEIDGDLSIVTDAWKCIDCGREWLGDTGFFQNEVK